LRQEHDDRANPAQHAVDQQRAKPAFRHRARDGTLHRSDAGFEPADRRFGPGEHRLKHEEHDGREDERSGKRMQRKPIDGAGRPSPTAVPADRQLGNSPRPALNRGELALHARSLLGRDCHAQRFLDLVEPAAAHRHRLHHRHAEFGAEPLDVDAEPIAAGEIDHIERDHRWQPEIDQLEGEAEVIVEIGRVQHDQQRVGEALALLAADYHIARDRLVGARRIEAVGAGQIDQLGRAPVRQGQPPRFTLDRNAR
jgi:hypothetical protein